MAHKEQIKKWVNADHTEVRIDILLAQRGVDVPHRTLARFAVERCGAGRRRTTVRVDDRPVGSARWTLAASGSWPMASGGGCAGR